MNLTLPYCEKPKIFSSYDNMVEFAVPIIYERNIAMSKTPHRAKELFVTLLQNFGSV